MQCLAFASRNAVSSSKFKRMGCAKDEESFQLRSTAEKASFWLLSFLASPKEEVAEADNVIVKVVENSRDFHVVVQKTPASAVCALQ